MAGHANRVGQARKVGQAKKPLLPRGDFDLASH
jgi:hypothetical protein